MDNVLCRAVQNGIRHCLWFPMTLQIDSLPVGVSEKDLLEALIQLLYQVCVFRSNIIVRDDLSCLYKFVLRHSMQILFTKVFSTLHSRHVAYGRKGGTSPRLRFALRSPTFGCHIVRLAFTVLGLSKLEVCLSGWSLGERLTYGIPA